MIDNNKRLFSETQVIETYQTEIAELKKQIATMEKALEAVILAFDVGDLGHLTLNGRGYSALEEARRILKNSEREE